MYVLSMMNASLGGCVIYSDAVPFDQNWCERLFEVSDENMAFLFDDFWTKLAKFAPSGIRDVGAYGMAEWTSMLLKQAKKMLVCATIWQIMMLKFVWKSCVWQWKKRE